MTTTIFGLDVSHYQAGLDLTVAKKLGFQFAVAKCTEGSGYADTSYDQFRAEAAHAGLLFGAYHFLRSDQSITAQADNIAAHIGDKTVPVLIDCEPSGASRPTLVHCNSLRSALAKRGITVTLLYLPHFWWEALGKPSLSGWHVWQALYGTNPHGVASAVYPGNESTRWAKQGGVTPTILQFGSRVKYPGHSGDIDADAYRGTRDDLVATGIFKDYSQPTLPKVAAHPHVTAALRINKEHVAAIRKIKRRTGSPFDLSLRAALLALRAERRALQKRVTQ